MVAFVCFVFQSGSGDNDQATIVVSVVVCFVCDASCNGVVPGSCKLSDAYPFNPDLKQLSQTYPVHVVHDMLACGVLVIMFCIVYVHVNCTLWKVRLCLYRYVVMYLYLSCYVNIVLHCYFNSCSLAL